MVYSLPWVILLTWAKTVIILPPLCVLLQHQSGRNRVHVEITAIGVYRIQEGHREDVNLNKIIICSWVRRVGTAQCHGEDIFLCTSDILGKLEQIPCRDRKCVPGGGENLFLKKSSSWGKSYPLWVLAHADKSFNMSPLMRNKFPNERKKKGKKIVTSCV